VSGFPSAGAIAAVGAKIYVGVSNGVSVCDAPDLTQCDLKSGGGALSLVNVYGITLYKDTLYIGSDESTMFMCNTDLTSCTATDGGGTFAQPAKLIVVGGV
jgi:hypothetical protein